MSQSGQAAHKSAKKSHSAYQIVTYSFFIIQNIWLEIGIQRQRFASIFLIFFQTWHYILIFYLIYQVLTVTKSDTRDPILRMLKSEDDFQLNQLMYCIMCNSIVLKSSYHCWRCNHCSQNLDHHCKFLNCCIAQKNYFAFLRLLVVFIFYNSDFIILVFNQTNFDLFVWGIFIGSIAYLIFTTSLFCFHVYLGQCYNGTTKNFCFRKISSQQKQIQLQQETYSFK